MKFMMQCFLLTTILLFGVLLGMQTAQQGLVKMKGYEEENMSGAFTISKTKEGEVEASVLGTTRVVDLQEKQKVLEERKIFNLFSSLGKQLATTVQSTIEKAVEAIHNVLSK
ncbi:YqxA family protein [Bacillus sp. CGMCC 1.16541]|uniref:YqxA family protein n=1 Tax=Bacillus sp. CGMCC 1.16541 TaxID=2185143 RepID=UPI000D729090|nr:YqxA family protein [Bacillus sp. CGMCC 1.16541]